MSRAIKSASVDQSTVIRIVDSTAGTPEEGVVAATAGLALWYRREGATKTALGALNDLATLDAAHNDNGILHIDEGYYRLDLPDAAFAAGASGVAVGGTATGMVVIAAYHAIDEPGLSMFPDGVVYVDSDDGVASSAWPYGTAAYPTSTIALGKVIADANNLAKIHIHGNHTLAAAMEDYSFVGSGHIDTTNVLDVNGQSIEHSTFTNQVITGAGGNAAAINDQAKYWDCYLYGHTNMQGEVYRGRVEGACSIRDTGYASFIDCLFGSSLPCTLTLQAPTVCDIEQMTGTLTLAGMDGGVCSISMSRGAVLTIDNTCTAGTITITGATEGVTDNSGVGCTVTIAVNAADAIQVSGDATAADDLELFIEALGTDDKVLVSTDAQDLSGTLDVNTKTITNGIIVAATLGADCITAAKIADDAIAAEHLATGALTADAFAADALVAATFATGAFTADAFAADALVAATFATGAFTADAFAADALVAATFATDSIAADALAADALAEINAQVVDALATDTYAEPGQGAPAATASLKDKIGYLYKNWRNKKVQDATTWELYADDASTVDQKATCSDDGTDATKGEIATGP
jgi:hypothetical protein